MKKIKRRILGIINIILPIILGIILLFADLSESVIYIMVMTLIIGWAIPFAVPIVTGLTIIYRKQPKLALIFNIVNLLLCIMIILLCIYLYDKKMLTMIIDYSIIGLLSIINIIYFIIYLKKHHKKNNLKEEYKEIKRIKENKRIDNKKEYMEIIRNLFLVNDMQLKRKDILNSICDEVLALDDAAIETVSSILISRRYYINEKYKDLAVRLGLEKMKGRKQMKKIISML